MHTTDYILNTRTRYIVHHDGDNTSEAVFSIDMEHEELQTTGATIEDVMNKVFDAKYNGENAIKINDVIFFIEGLEPILVSMVADNIHGILDDNLHKMSIEDVIDLEQDITRLASD